MRKHIYTGCRDRFPTPRSAPELLIRSVKSHKGLLMAKNGGIKWVGFQCHKVKALDFII